MAEQPDGDRPSSAFDPNPRDSDKAGLTSGQRRAARLLALGRKQVVVARMVGVCKDTIINWKKNPEFRAEIESHHQSALDTIRGKIEGSFPDAMKALANLRDCAQDEGVRLGAAKAQADYAARLLLAVMAQQAKARDTSESADERASAIIESLEEMDSRSGDLA